jgi:hypothetical protein
MKTRTILAMIFVIASVSVSSLAHTVYLDIQKDRLISQQIAHIRFHSYDAKITDEGKAHNLDNYGKWHLSKNATNLSVRVHERNRINEIKLPEKVSQRFLALFKESPTKTQCGRDFDCTCFAHYAHGIDPKEVFDKLRGLFFDPTAERRVLEEYWQIEAFWEGDLQPSDVVKLSAGMDLHFAIYLSPGVYISKFGEGAVYATDLGEMERVYPFRHKQIWRPVDKRSCGEQFFTDPIKVTLGACFVAACALTYFFL